MKNKVKSVATPPSFHTEVARYLFNGIASALIAGCMVAVLLAGVLWEYGRHMHIAIWLVLVESVYIARFVMAVAFKHADQTDGLTWLRRFRLGVLVSSLVWAGAILLFYAPGNPLDQALMTLLVTGLTAGGTVAYVVDAISLFGFIIPLGLSLIVRLLLEGTPYSITLGMGVELFLLYVLVGVRRNRADIHANIRMRLEAIRREETVREKSELLAAIFENEPECVKVVAADGSLLQMNQAGLEMLEVASLEEAREHNLIGFIEPSYRAAFLNFLRRVIDGESARLEHQIIGRKGTRRWLDSHAVPLRDASGQHTSMLAITRDITAQKLSKLEEAKLRRTVALMNKCGSLLIRTSSEQELLAGICRLTVEVGGYLMAWVGFARDDEARSVVPVAQFGLEEGYLQSLRISWADEPQGRGPTGTAIRTGLTSCTHDIQRDARMVPWRESAIKRGYNASIAFPLIIDGRTIGALSIYSAEPNAFGQEEVVLLEELTNDLAFGIQTLRVRVEKESALRALKHESEKNLALLHNASDGIHILDQRGNIIEASDSFCDMLGYRREEIIGMNIAQWDAGHASDAEREAELERQFARQAHFQYETRHRCRNGKVFDVEVSSFPLELDGKPVLFNSSRDITERKQMEENLRIAATAFESQEGIVITDADNNILRVNRAFTAITGYSMEEVVGKNPRILGSGRQEPDFYADMWESIRSLGKWEGEIWNRRKNGEIYPEHMSISAVTDRKGNITNYVATLFDITESKAAENEIKHLAFYDPLTHLPNRRLLMDRLRQAFASSSRNRRQGAILFLDLDNFKNLNDTLGHDMGDLLLQQVARRLETCVREGDTVARLGGDEFVVMLEELSQQSLEAAAQAEAVCEKILAAFNQPYQLGAGEFRSTVSIGAVLFRGHRQTVEELMKQADIALYQAKKSGRNTLRFFDPEMQEAISARTALEEELHKALQKNQFHLYYQVQVNASGLPEGAEVLIRWAHPRHGIVSPAQFIQLAEDTGLILPIGQWILENACRQLACWQSDPVLGKLALAVNISGRQFRQPDFVDQVRAVIQRHALKPMRLKLELTESVVLGDFDDAVVKMRTLKELGIQVSLDDFGTGYSSLSYLKRLPLDQIKIDQSFVRDINIDQGDVVMVRTIVDLGINFGLDIIAEGVETEAQFRLLQRYGCTGFQGYLFGKAVPVEQFEELIRTNQKLPA